MKKLFLVQLMMLLVCGLISIGFAAPSASPESQALKIGVPVVLTGPGSEVGVRILKGAQLAASWINSKGGITIGGRKYLIELIVEDEKSTVDSIVTAATKLVEDHKVKFISGGASPLNVMTAATVTEKARVLRSTWWGEGSPLEMSNKTPYTFRANTGTRDSIPGVYKYLAEAYPSVKRIAIVGVDSPSAPFIFDITKKEGAEALGLTVVSTETYPRTTQDFFPLVTKILSSRPDAIGNTGGWPMFLGNILKTARQMGFKGPVFGTGPAPTEEIGRVAGKDSATDWFNTSPVVNSPMMTPMIKEIKKMHLDKYGHFNLDYLQGWDGIWCLVQAIEKAQSLDPFVVAETWGKMNRIETAYGAGTMGGLKTYGVNHVVVKPFPISRLMNGEPEHVKWILPEVP